MCCWHRNPHLGVRRCGFGPKAGLSEYHGWTGKALRVPPEEYEQRVARSREAMKEASKVEF